MWGGVAARALDGSALRRELEGEEAPHGGGGGGGPEHIYEWVYGEGGEGDDEGGGGAAGEVGIAFARVAATVTAFPVYRGLEDAFERKAEGDADRWHDVGAGAPAPERAYDPAFVLPLLAHLLTRSRVPLRRLVACGGLGCGTA